MPCPIPYDSNLRGNGRSNAPLNCSNFRKSTTATLPKANPLPHFNKSCAKAGLIRSDARASKSHTTRCADLQDVFGDMLTTRSALLSTPPKFAAGET